MWDMFKRVIAGIFGVLLILIGIVGVFSNRGPVMKEHKGPTGRIITQQDERSTRYYREYQVHRYRNPKRGEDFIMSLVAMGAGIALIVKAIQGGWAGSNS